MLNMRLLVWIKTPEEVCVYLRHTTVKRNGKERTYWRLVRSVRQGRKVRQETVAFLGELDAKERAKASALARHFLGERADQLDLFEDRTSLEIQRVRVNEVRVERGRSFGDVWLGWLLWQALELDKFCARALPKGRVEVAWAEIAMILVIARLCEPSSELHIAEDWYRRTALEDLIGVDPKSVHHTRLYQGLDKLLDHKQELEAHLKNRLGSLFELDYDLMLYDVTSTYFEGQAKANHLANRGHSRDRRSDCKQVCIGLVVSREGFPVGYEVFEGNRNDVTTVEEIVEEMERRYGRARRVWVMDRGMISADILQWLNKGDRKYVVGTPKGELKNWEREIVERSGWEDIREDIEVKLCRGLDATETFILCRSVDRKEKDKAIRERFAKRIREGLEKLERRLARARKPADRSQVERQIGRLLGRNSRAAGKFHIEVKEDKSIPSGLKATWEEQPQWNDWAELTDGMYILRSNVTDWSAEELWNLYIQLTEAEAAFRIHKSDLGIRPIRHQTAERTQAHILVCFLGYALWRTLAGWQKKAGLGSSPRTLIEEFGRIQSVDVVLPLENDRELRLRCVVRPDKAQAALLDRLGLRLPKRLKPPRPLSKM
jgi:transposase